MAVPQAQESGQESSLEHKTIDIRTTRVNGVEIDGQHLLYNGGRSLISFSEPITDYEGKENRSLTLNLTICSGGFGTDRYWFMGLDDERGYSLTTAAFGDLKGNLDDYSKKKLKGWQDSAQRKYKEVLDAIEEAFWKNKEIGKSFLRNIVR